MQASFSLFVTTLLQAPKCGQLISLCPQNINSSISHYNFGVISAFSNNTIFVFNPVVAGSDLKFAVFSKKISSHLNCSTSSSNYISRRRWNQRSVSEVDLNILHTFYQVEVNLIMLSRSFPFLQDLNTDNFDINRFISKSIQNLTDLSFLGLVNSTNFLYLFRMNLNDSGLRNNLTVTNQFPAIQEFIVETHLIEHCSLLCTDSYKCIHDKISCSSIVAADLSSVFTGSDGLRFILLASGKRDGCLHICQLNVSPAFIVSDFIIKHQRHFYLNSFTWIEKLCWSGIYHSNISFLVLCFVDGTIKIVRFIIESGKFTTCDIISEPDGAKITHILWSFLEDIPTLFFIKGSNIFLVSIPPDNGNGQFNCSIIYQTVSSPFPMNSLDCIFNSLIVIGFQNCTFAIFKVHEFSLNLLSAESLEFSEYIHNYMVEHISSVPQIVGFLFSPYSLYMLVVFIGTILSEHIDCLTYSRQSIIFIPLFKLPFVCSNIRTLSCQLIRWDMIKCCLFCRRYNNLEIMSSLFPTMSKIVSLKLKYISDVSYGTLCPSTSTTPLLKYFNSQVISAILKNYNLKTEFEIFFNFEDRLIRKPQVGVCEICDLSLENDQFNIEISCLGNHTFDRCLFTFEIIRMHDEYLYCSICNRKILKYAFKLLSNLFGQSVQIFCPLCDGVFIQCLFL